MSIDPALNPVHYTQYNDLEVIQLTEQMNFNRGNAVKYVARAGHKNKMTEEQDLEKAIWYLRREIERLKKNKTRPLKKRSYDTLLSVEQVQELMKKWVHP